MKTPKSPTKGLGGENPLEVPEVNHNSMKGVIMQATAPRSNSARSIRLLALVAVAMSTWAHHLVAQTTVDPGFDPNADARVRAMVVRTDNLIVAGGEFLQMRGSTRTRLALLNADGTLDPVFQPAANDAVFALALQTDGKILVGGAFNTLAGSSKTFLGRLNSNGTLDGAFNPALNNWVRDIAIQSDGKIIVGGSLTSLGGQTRNNVGRINSDGGLDTGFNPNANAQVNALLVQPDGKILIGGFFTSVGGQAHTNIARLNTNGTPDATFTAQANNVVWKLALQSDGKIVLGGVFTLLNGQPRTNLARLNANGSLDTGFTTAANSTVNGLVLQNDGKIVVGGNFSTLGGQPHTYIARLNSDGSLDPSFSLGASNTLYSLAIQPDQSLLVGGDFISIGGTPRNHLARLTTSSSSSSKVSNDNLANAFVITNPLPFIVSGDNVGATKEVGEPDHDSSAGGTSVWWSWTAPFNGPVVLDWTMNNFPSLVAVYTGNTIATLSPAIASGSSFPNSLAFTAVAGTTYKIAVDGQSGATGDIVLSLLSTPGNDNFPNRYVITGAVNFVTGFNFNATKEVGEPDHVDNPGGASVWWSWTAPASGPVALDTTGSSIDTLLAVYRGTSVSALTLVASNDYHNFGGQGGRARLGFTATAGTAYQIAIDGQFGAEGFLVLSLRSGAAATNDAFASRSLITATDSVVTGDNINATKEGGEPDHGNNPGGRSVWWTWTAATTGIVTLDASDSSFLPIVAVYTGNSVAALVPVANVDASTDPRRFTFLATNGITYQIAVDSATDSGNIVLKVVAIPSGSDSFSNRTPLTGSTANVLVNNVLATKQAGEPNHAGNGGGKSVWWTWTAPANGVCVLDTIGSSFDTLLGVYTNTAVNALSLVASDNDSGGNGTSKLSFNTVSGRIYQIAIDGFGAASGLITLNLQLWPSSSDSFAGRLSIVGLTNTVFGQNFGATSETGEPNHAGFAGGKSVWWTWTAPANRLMTLDTVGSSFDTLLAVYTGSSVGALTPIASDDDGTAFPANGQSKLTFLATSGTPYRIAVDGKSGATGTIVLNLRPTPANDAFANATPISGSQLLINGSNAGATTELNEPCLYQHFSCGASVWWAFTPPASGIVTIEKVIGPPSLHFAVHQGSGIVNLVQILNNEFQDAFPNPPQCSASFPAQGGQVYYIAVDTLEGEVGPLTLNLTLASAPANDNFASRIPISNPPGNVTGSTAGATTELNEPDPALPSIWWSWTANQTGPVILTTTGSSADTFLTVFTGSAINSLSLITCNDDAYVFPTLFSPTADVISRVKFNAVSGTTYQLRVASNGGTGPSVMLNFPSIAIEDLLSLNTTFQPDRSIDFTAKLLLTNLKAVSTGPLRIRLIGRAGYSHLNSPVACGDDVFPPFNIPDEELAIINLSSPSNLGSLGSTQMTVNGRCSPPYEVGNWGLGWSVLGALEENVSGVWQPRDSRLLVIGQWPRVNGFIGPGGGVITISPTFGSSAQPVLLDVYLGPISGVRAGGAWRISPTDNGGISSYYSSQWFTSAYRQVPVNGLPFTIQTISVAGFTSPANQIINITQSGARLDLTYLVNPPQLTISKINGIGISGTTGTVYSIDYTPQVPTNNWSSLLNVSLLKSGVNSATNPITTNDNLFYRARWLPDQ